MNLAEIVMVAVGMICATLALKSVLNHWMPITPIAFDPVVLESRVDLLSEAALVRELGRRECAGELSEMGRAAMQVYLDRRDEPNDEG